MKNIFTRFFSFMLLFCVLGVINELFAQSDVPQLSTSNIELVPKPAKVSDSAYVTYQVVAYTNAEYAFNMDNDPGGWSDFSGDSAVAVKEGIAFSVIAPVVDTLMPGDSIEINHPLFEIVFESAVMAGDEGTLVVYAQGDTTMTPVLAIPITQDMIDGSSITVDYRGSEHGYLDYNTSYVVKVDSGVVRGWGGIMDDSWTFTTGNNNATPAEAVLNVNDFKVFPNPFVNEINIENSDKLTGVILTNIAGQRVLDIENPERVIYTGKLVSGVYVITLIKDGSIVKSERIIKQR